MFVDLPTNTRIYALSAANPKESSWGTYCSPDDVIQGKHIGSCLGDLFSCKFVEDSEGDDLTKETLQTQFEKIRALTTLSHVMQWGDVSFTSEPVSDFIGPSHPSLINLRKPRRSLDNLFWRTSSSMDSRLMKIQILTEIYKREKTSEAEKEMREEMIDMQRHDNIFSPLIKRLHLTGDYEPRAMNYECMRSVMDNHTEKCGRLSDYGLTYAKYYAEACERYSAGRIIEEVQC